MVQLIRTQNRSGSGLTGASLIALCDVSICKAETETLSSAQSASLSRKTITHNLTCSVTSSLFFLPPALCSEVPGTFRGLIKTLETQLVLQMFQPATAPSELYSQILA